MGACNGPEYSGFVYGQVPYAAIGYDKAQLT